jgi:pSer/pThr/pTyr-binding forkhead associated (FHA) protein
VIVAGEQVTVVDLESKNGTYVRGERIQSAVAVADGDEIRIGPAAFTLRVVSAAAPTQTQ